MGKLADAGWRDAPDFRHHDDGCESAARPDSGQDAGRHRQDDWALWLGEAEGDVTSLLRAVPVDVLRLWPVGKKVGNVRNNGPELLEPQPETEPELDLPLPTEE
jgi:hypothetical protein